ncbi:hypothetical protein L1987_52034 [Smallanthus sonchifolius]|uniref:Uncharacterized protein n=1 Tax=Smallanthus sonchifolius TaxID=185202 RepID=A0ACB9ESQ5_9ASTR|nr:hypothetical protein L1987_52034 [Smallanthus sonchifolius]
MQEIHINNARLSVNLAKFDRDGKPNNREVKGFRSGPDNSKHHPSCSVEGKEDNSDKPFLRALLRNQDPSTHKMEVTIRDDADYDVVEWYDKSVIGKAIDITQLRGLHEFLSGDGLTDIKLKYLGGLQILIIFKKYSDAEDFVRQKPRWSEPPAPAEVLVRPEEDEKITLGYLEPRSAQEPPVQGDLHSSCMGKADSSINDSSNKKSVIKFGSGNSNNNSPVQTKSKLEEAAHRIIITFGPNPRKRPRTGSFDNDPFLLDDIIKKTGKAADYSGNQNPNPWIPDLNTAMVNPPIETSDKKEEGRTISVSIEKAGSVDQEGLNRGVKATMEVGAKLGINLKEQEDLVRMIIQGEGENIGLP